MLIIKMNVFLFKWQGLVGSLVGASVPLILFLLTNWYLRYLRKEEHISRINNIIVCAVNNLIDIDKTVREFSDIRLVNFIDRIKEDTANNNYSLGTTYFPLFAKVSFPEDILNHSTRSGYVDNKIMQLFLMSKDFTFVIDDIKRQFEGTLEVNKTITLEKLNAHGFQNNSLIMNIGEYRTLLDRDFLKNNLCIYLKHLAIVGIAIRKLKSLGLLRWKLKFGPSFKYFKDKDIYNKYIEKTQERIDEYLKEETASEIKRLFSNLSKDTLQSNPNFKLA